MITQLTLIILIIMILASNLRIASEYQRFAFFRIGRYFGLKGPGLIFMIPFIDRCFRISIGDQGQLINDSIGKFKEIELPVEYSERIYIGSKIKVYGFLNNKVQVGLESDQKREVKW